MPNTNVTKILEEAYARGAAAAKNGHVATYIPELSKADPAALGICMCLPDGTYYEIGDTDKRFTIQSISKIITLAMAIEQCGPKEIFSRVGMEPSAEAFDSIVELDLSSNRPYNPMINSGAITVASILKEYVTINSLLKYTRKVCLDPDIDFDETVYKSEKDHMSRNRSIGYLLESKGIITTGVEASLEFYTRACSMNVTAKSLANLGVVLAMDGVDPFTGEQLMPRRIAEVVKTIMLTCGMYDSSGEFAVMVGIPTKSGVGGGLLSASDDRLGIGIYGPALDEKGNCIAGRPVLEYLSEELELSLFDKADVVHALRNAGAEERKQAQAADKKEQAAGEGLRMQRHQDVKTFMPYNVKKED